MKIILKLGLVLFFASAVSMAAGSFLFAKKGIADVRIKNRHFQAETASSPTGREKGLGGRNSLCENCAMLFIFPSEGKYAFHMKGMKFNLDFIWISGGKIVHITRNVPYDSKETINSPVLADMVLEISAGLSDKYSFREGDSVEIGY
ncbi:MAG: uncharacterized protein QG620_727 [Patescibacteria group bacterium]|nr:uncharacterized protein [Patescibacteria group bacterium]